MKSKGDDNTYSWILPVDIDAVEVMVLDEVGNVGGHCQPISRSDTVTENHVRARIGGKCPSTDRQDTRCAYDLFEQVELVGGTRRGAVGDLDLIRRGEGTKSEINVCVSTQVNLRDILIEARPLQVETLVEANFPVCGRFITLHNSCAAVRDTAVGTILGGSRGASAGVDTEVGCCTALEGLSATLIDCKKSTQPLSQGSAYLAPHITARIQRALVECGNIRSPRGGQCSGNLWPTFCIGKRGRHWRITLT